jgi:hypothetical protein
VGAGDVGPVMLDDVVVDLPGGEPGQVAEVAAGRQPGGMVGAGLQVTLNSFVPQWTLRMPTQVGTICRAVRP